MIYIAIIVLAAALVYFLFPKKKKPARVVIDGMYITPQGESSERIKKLKMDKAAEDFSHLLDVSKLNFPRVKETDENKEYKPLSVPNYIINIDVPPGTILKKDDLWALFDIDWRKKYPMADVYGRSHEDNLWTFVMAGDSAETYDALLVSVKLTEISLEETDSLQSEMLKQFTEDLHNKLSQLPAPVQIRETESLDDAMARAKKLIDRVNHFNREVIIVLHGERPFDGRKAWDVLTGTGLQWGDGDLFHWINDFEYGDQHFFTVWTLTNPGYFLPEVIKRGQFNPINLAFGFSIPRSADPVNIFESMLDVVQHCQKKLGGIMLDEKGESFKIAEKRKWLSEMVIAMKDEDMTPGSPGTLFMFN